jgi:hypothetical protein
VWFVGQSVRHLQCPFCGWCSWAGPCVLLEIHWEFCGCGLDDMGWPLLCLGVDVCVWWEFTYVFIFCGDAGFSFGLRGGPGCGNV